MSLRYRVTLVPLPGGGRPFVRVRQALKTLLRIHRLRCESVEEIEPAEEPRSGGVAPSPPSGEVAT